MNPRPIAAVAALLGAAALAGCIGTELPWSGPPGGPGPERPVATFTARDYALTGPATVPAGWVDIALVNEGRELHHAYVLRLDPGRTLAEFREHLQAGRGPPAWALAAGGPNAVEPGQTASATSRLEPGIHVVLCVIPDAGHVGTYLHGMVTSFRVEGPARGSEPAPDQRVALADYAFGADRPLAPGLRTIAYRNVGQELHEAVLLRLDPGHTPDDVLAVLAGEAPGPPPGRFLGGVVGVEPGDVAYVTQRFEPGRYAYLCFFGEESGQPPHFTRGMRMEFDVA